MAGDPPARHLEPDQPALHAFGLLPGEGTPADEVAGTEPDHPAEVRFEGSRVVGQVVPIERELALQTKGVARAKANRLAADSASSPNRRSQRTGASFDPHRISKPSSAV